MTEDITYSNFLDKFIRLTRIDENGCLIWVGHTTRDGYPRVTYKGRSRFVHRLGWTMARGPIPTGMVLCHSCDNPSCVNIDHLRVGTQNDNVQDMVSKGRHYRIHKTLGVCRRGHAMTDENTYTKKCGYTYCRTCIKITKQKYKRKYS